MADYRLHQTGDEVQRILDNEGIGDCLKLKPYGYQRQAIAFGLRNGSALLRMPCGSGKTPCGLGLYLELRNREPDQKLVGVFVVKVALKQQWIDEVAKFTDLRVGEITTYNAATSRIAARIRARQKKLEKFIAAGPAEYARQNNLAGFSMELVKRKQEISGLEQEKEDAFNSLFDTDKYDIFVVNYEAVRDEKVREKLLEVHPEFWYVDEIDYIKSPDADRSQAMYAFNDAKYRFGATATPIRKNPLDLYGIFRFIRPELFKSKAQFCDRYLIFSRKYRRYTGAQNEKELAAKVAPYIFARSLDEIADQLPQQSVYQIPCYFTQKQQKMWQRIYQELDELNEKGMALASRMSPAELAKSEEYQRIQNGIAARQTFAQMQTDTEELLELSDSRMAKQYITGDPSGKVEKCMMLLDKILSSGEKCVIFSKYLRMQDILEREIHKIKEFKDIKIDRIIGDTSAAKRAAILKEYNSKADHRVLLLSDSGEAGLNLSTTKYMIEFELADSAAKQTQRHGRIQRADSKHKNVFVYQLITQDSYDDTIALRSIQKKEGYAEKIL